MIGIKQILTLYPLSPCIKEKRWRKCTRFFQDSLIINLLSVFMFPGMGLWRRKWQTTPVFLPRDSHGQRSLPGYRPWGCKESDTTERLTQHTGWASVQ